jgi:hypothetical protein
LAAEGSRAKLDTRSPTKKQKRILLCGLGYPFSSPRLENKCRCEFEKFRQQRDFSVLVLFGEFNLWFSGDFQG